MGKQLEVLKADITAKNETVRTLEATVKEVKEQNQKLKLDKSELEKQLEVLKADITAKNETIRKLESEKKILTKQVHTLETRISKMEITIRTTTEETSTLRTPVENAQQVKKKTKLTKKRRGRKRKNSSETSTKAKKKKTSNDEKPACELWKLKNEKLSFSTKSSTGKPWKPRPAHKVCQVKRWDNRCLRVRSNGIRCNLKKGQSNPECESLKLGFKSCCYHIPDEDDAMQCGVYFCKATAQTGRRCSHRTQMPKNRREECEAKYKGGARYLCYKHAPQTNEEIKEAGMYFTEGRHLC